MKQVTFNQNFNTFMNCRARMVQIVEEHSLLATLRFPNGDKIAFAERARLEILRNYYELKLNPRPFTAIENEIGEILTRCNINIGDAKPGDLIFDELVDISVALLVGCFDTTTPTIFNLPMAYLGGYHDGYVSYDPSLHMTANGILSALNYVAITEYLSKHQFDPNCFTALTLLKERFGEFSFAFICDYAQGKLLNIAD